MPHLPRSAGVLALLAALVVSFPARAQAPREELVRLVPDEEEIAYRRLYTQPNVGRYREGYAAARAAKDDFAAAFYLKLLQQHNAPPIPADK